MNIVFLDRKSVGNDLDYTTFSSLGAVTIYESTKEGEVIARASDADVIVINKVKINEDILKGLPRLKLICITATGFDNVDVECAKKIGVGVCNVPAYSTDSVSLVTIAVVTNLISKLNIYNRFVTNGDYTAAGLPNKISPIFHEIKDKTWGIIGYGNIGRAVGHIAEAMGARVIATRRNLNSNDGCVSLEELLKESDIITIHCPLNDGTYHLLNQDNIYNLKDGAIVVNMARGAVVDEASIYEALIKGKISGFGADVYPLEPFPEDSYYFRMKDMDNVLLTPHCSWASYESRSRCLATVYNNIKSYIDGETRNRLDM